MAYADQSDLGMDVQEPAPDDNMDTEEGSESTLVNKSVCPDCKPGDVLKFKVDRVLDDELSLTYMDKEGGEEDAAPAEAAPSSAESDSMGME
jgi:hypothetical protein